MKYVGEWLGAGAENTLWLMKEMDVTQWGIVAALFVVAGFMCLRSQL